MVDFWVVGSIAWDHVLYVPSLPLSGGFTRATAVLGRPGGTGANTAIALAGSGAAVHMVGYVGEDEPGARLLATLETAGVDTRFVEIRGEPTFEVVILVEPSGQRSIIDIRPSFLDAVRVPVGETRPGDVVYFAAWRSAFRPVMGQLTARGVLVATIPPLPPAPAVPAAFLIGAQDQYGSQDPAGAIRDGDATLQAVIVTCGADGVIVHDRGGTTAFPVRRVAAVDTTGAGDAFAAGFLFQVAGGAGRDQAITVGMAWAAAAVQIPSSILPQPAPGWFLANLATTGVDSHTIDSLDN